MMLKLHYSNKHNQLVKVTTQHDGMWQNAWLQRGQKVGSKDRAIKKKDERNVDYISKQHNKSKKRKEALFKEKEQRTNQQTILSNHRILNWLQLLDSLNQSMIHLNSQPPDHQSTGTLDRELL